MNGKTYDEYLDSYRDDMNEVFEDSEHMDSRDFRFPRYSAAGSVFGRKHLVKYRFEQQPKIEVASISVPKQSNRIM